MRAQFCTESRAAASNSEVVGIQGKAGAELAVSDGRRSITVLQPISKPWGLTPQEIRVASEAGHWMAGLDEPLWYAVLADRHRPEREVRWLVRELKSDIVQAQRDAGTAPYWLQISEGSPAYHANIVFPLGGPKAKRLIERIGRSELFPGDILDIQPVFDVQGVIGYCAEERTPQASYMSGLKMMKRARGSHPLGEGGGDRVSLSRALRTHLVESGRIRPFRRSYASRALPTVSTDPRAILVGNSAPAVPAPTLVPDPHGLFGPLAEQPVRPKPWVRTGQRRAKLTVANQIPLAFSLSPDAIDLMASLGETHDAIAAKVGLSRPQTTNVLNRQFGASRIVVRRVLQLARAA